MYLFEYSSDLIHTTLTTYQLSKVFQILIFEKNFDVLFAEIMQRIWMEFIYNALPLRVFMTAI